jgi:hypothetical protein
MKKQQGFAWRVIYIPGKILPFILISVNLLYFFTKALKMPSSYISA